MRIGLALELNRMRLSSLSKILSGAMPVDDYFAVIFAELARRASKAVPRWTARLRSRSPRALI